jgi:DNA-binding transcriptional MerR regulator
MFGAFGGALASPSRADLPEGALTLTQGESSNLVVVMFTIGSFAQLAGVSVRTLRHYERVGLLVPASVDAATGYRRYSADQLPRLHRIVALKELGLSLRQIRPLLATTPSVEQLSELLACQREELAERVAADQARLARVERRLRYIEMEDAVPIDIVIKHIPAMRVAEVRWSGKALAFGEVKETFLRPRPSDAPRGPRAAGRHARG